MAIIIPHDEEYKFYKNLKIKIEEKGYSLKKISEEIGMSVNGIYAAFNNQSLKVGTIIKILKVLKVDFQDLFEYNTEKDNAILRLEKQIEESEELIKILRNKIVQITSNFEIALLFDAKKTLLEITDTIYKLPIKVMEKVVCNYPEVIDLVKKINPILLNIVKQSSEDENVKIKYQKTVDEFSTYLKKIEHDFRKKQASKKPYKLK